MAGVDVERVAWTLQDKALLDALRGVNADLVCLQAVVPGQKQQIHPGTFISSEPLVGVLECF